MDWEGWGCEMLVLGVWPRVAGREGVVVRSRLVG